jgi:hypothetical protein
MRTRTTLLVALAATALTAAACDSGGGTETAATTPAAAPPPPPAAPPPPPPPPAAELVGLATPFPSEAEWSAACQSQDLDKTICDCAGKATVATLGAQALYTWVHEAYIRRNAVAQNRSKNWFTSNGIDTAAQQKFADAVGKCYVKQ